MVSLFFYSFLNYEAIRVSQFLYTLLCDTIPNLLRHPVETIVKSYRCPKFVGDAKQTLEIRVERKRNLKVGEVGDESIIIYKLAELGEVSFGTYK